MIWTLIDQVSTFIPKVQVGKYMYKQYSKQTSDNKFKKSLKISKG
jgi:hypothetical protein